MRPGILVVALLPTLVLALSACGGGLSEADKHYNVGVELWEEGRLEEAIAEYDEAIRLDPQDAVAQYSRGNFYLNLGQYEKAIHDFDEAIRLDPDLALAYNSRGDAYAYLGQYERAIHDFDETIRLDPDLALAYNGRGLVYNNLEAWPESGGGCASGYTWGQQA